MKRLVPGVYSANSVLCIPEGSNDGKWGYVIANKQYLINDRLHIVYKPFWYSAKPSITCRLYSYRARPDRLYMVKRKPFCQYTNYETDDVTMRPLKEDCIVVIQPSIVRLLETLTLEYKYQYVMRCTSVKNILPTLKSGELIKDKHLRCSIFRVQDVLPSDIINTDGLCIKVHDGKYDYLDIVFSDNANMFNTDGFEFKPLFAFDEAIYTAEEVIFALEKLKSRKPTKPKKVPNVDSNPTSKITYSFITSATTWTTYTGTTF